jgi:Protein of unknown function (DUF2934)
MNFDVADLQRQREEVRARLLADEEIRERISFRAFEIYQHRGAGHGSALADWVQAEDEIVSALLEQELQPSSEPTGGNGFKGELGPRPRLRAKAGKKSKSRAASVSDTAPKRKAKVRPAGPISSRSVKKKTNTSRTAKKSSDVNAKRKERRESESRSA